MALLKLLGSTPLSTQSTPVDALPYIDLGYDDAARAGAIALIEEECKIYRPTKNYLENFPPPKYEAFETEMMKAEFERIHGRQPMELLNMKRYELPDPPAGRLTDVSAWNEAVENSCAQLEHQQIRLENLQLLTEFGTEAWKQYVQTVQRMVDQSQKRLADLRGQIQEINYTRKKEQTSVGAKMKDLESSWVGLISKNYEIERAVLEMEERIRQLQSRA